MLAPKRLIAFGLVSDNTNSGVCGRARCRRIAKASPRFLPEFAMYRPKFCAECGVKVIRLRWRPWTNRRFCDHCAPRYFKQQITHLLSWSLVLFLLGAAIGHAARPAAPPLLIERRWEAPAALSDGPRPADATGASSDKTNGNTQTMPGSAAPMIEEAIYTCGARTKRGTPCTRRVHGPVRCWQHKGLPAMLPQEKLLIKD